MRPGKRGVGVRGKARVSSFLRGFYLTPEMGGVKIQISNPPYPSLWPLIGWWGEGGILIFKLIRGGG
jgi:hypothetical protein